MLALSAVECRFALVTQGCGSVDGLPAAPDERLGGVRAGVQRPACQEPEEEEPRGGCGNGQQGPKSVPGRHAADGEGGPCRTGTRSRRARGTKNGPAVAQIAGVFATKSPEIARCNRGLPCEDWHLIKSQSGISRSNEPFGSYLRILFSITYKMMVVGGRTGQLPCRCGSREPVARGCPPCSAGRRRTPARTPSSARASYPAVRGRHGARVGGGEVAHFAQPRVLGITLIREKRSALIRRGTVDKLDQSGKVRRGSKKDK